MKNIKIIKNKNNSSNKNAKIKNYKIIKTTLLILRKTALNEAKTKNNLINQTNKKPNLKRVKTSQRKLKTN
jgi:hypothetical protein